MEVSDDGRGFDPAAAWRLSGLGLRAMRERVEELGGSLEIESDADRGTHLRVVLPARAS